MLPVGISWRWNVKFHVEQGALSHQLQYIVFRIDHIDGVLTVGMGKRLWLDVTQRHQSQDLLLCNMCCLISEWISCGRGEI